MYVTDLQNFWLTESSDAINAAAALHSMPTAAHVLIRKYRKLQQSNLRRLLEVSNLGEFEFSPYVAWHTEAFAPEAENNLVSGEIADPNDDQI